MLTRPSIRASVSLYSSPYKQLELYSPVLAAAVAAAMAVANYLSDAHRRRRRRRQHQSFFCSCNVFAALAALISLARNLRMSHFSNVCLFNLPFDFDVYNLPSLAIQECLATADLWVGC